MRWAANGEVHRGLRQLAAAVGGRSLLREVGNSGHSLFGERKIHSTGLRPTTQQAASTHSGSKLPQSTVHFARRPPTEFNCTDPPPNPAHDPYWPFGQ
jgi:hypothetical protein